MLPDTFFENEARKHLLKLCSFGPKPAGSFANEIEAVQYITDQINAVKQSNINNNNYIRWIYNFVNIS
jgi:hypothetical protein